MALTTNLRSNSMGVVNCAVGKIASNADAAAAYDLELGFAPRHFQFVNLTDRISYDWYEGMTAGTALKTAADGARTLDAGNAIVVAGNVVTLAAAALVASKAFAWVAQG